MTTKCWSTCIFTPSRTSSCTHNTMSLIVVTIGIVEIRYIYWTIQKCLNFPELCHPLIIVVNHEEEPGLVIKVCTTLLHKTVCKTVHKLKEECVTYQRNHTTSQEPPGALLKRMFHFFKRKFHGPNVPLRQGWTRRLYIWRRVKERDR